MDTFVYVSGYSNSEPTLSVGKYDMFIIQITASAGAIGWVKRIGSSNNDKANGVVYYQKLLYVVGESDSPGWTSAKTDMIFM